jgi:hypothetical protein
MSKKEITIGTKVRLKSPPIHKNKIAIIIGEIERRQDDDYHYYVFIDRDNLKCPIYDFEIKEIISKATSLRN